MSQYVIKRLLLMIPTAFLVTVIIFGLMKLVPGDVAIIMVYGGGDEGAAVGSKAAAEQSLEDIRARYGLDRSLPVQYYEWVKSVGRGRFGESIWQARPVRDVIWERAPRTAELALVIMVLTVAWSIPLGIMAAIWQGTAKDHIVRVLSVSGLSIPTIFLGTVFLFTFSRYVGWIPPLDWKGPFEDPIHNLKIVGPPSLIVAFSIGAPMLRMTRSQMLEVIREDYLRTARAKGLSEWVVVIRHGLRNAVLPVLTQLGGLFHYLLLGSVIVETVFHIPGMGKSLVDAIGNRDYPVVQGLVLMNVAVTLVLNLVIDLLYSVVDPRIRYS